MKIRKTILILCSLLVCAFLFFALFAGFEWRKCASSGEKAVLSGGSTLPKEIFLGNSIPVRYEIRVPWARRIRISDEPVPGKGTQFQKAPMLEKKKISWGNVLYTLTFYIQPYLDGKAGEGSFALEIEGGKEHQQILKGKLPGMTVLPRKILPGDAPIPAGKVDPASGMKEKRKLWVIAAAVLVLLAALYFILRRFLRKKLRERIVPPWEKALAGIGDLRKGLCQGLFTPELATGKLSDVVRSYLEERFSLRAAHQTTREFLNEIESSGPLEEKHRKFLRDFLNCVDLVKFARLPAGTGLFEDTANKAEILISETTIRPEKDEGKLHE